MTSSLVGSEMCIRDRRKTSPSVIRYSACRSPVLEEAGAKVASDHPRPVSYTHLTLPTICSV
eukprot:231820-Prorocentrum_lima.AAC.1